MCFRYSHFCSTVSLHADQCTEGQKRSKSSETLLPTEWMWSNFKEVFSANNYQIITAFKNSIILTIGS